MYAIVKTGGKQYRIEPGDKLDVEKLSAEVGDTINLQALLVNDGKTVTTGAEELAKAEIIAEVLDHHKGEKQLVFKFKKRKGYKRTKGHRQQLTRIAVKSINGVEAKKADFKKTDSKKSSVKKTSEKDELEKKDVAVSKEAPEKKQAKQAPKKEVSKEKAPVKSKAKKDSKDSNSSDLSSMTVAQLREYAKERGISIPTSARKAQIIEIIEKA